MIGSDHKKMIGKIIDIDNPAAVGRPSVLARFRRSDKARKLGKIIARGAKKIFFTILDLTLSDRQQGLDEVRQVHKLLMVRPNFRVGNILITARLIPSVRARFPDARIDFLGTAPTLDLLKHLGLGRLEALCRSHSYHWIAFLKLIRRLRKEHYDAVIDCGGGSVTSALLSCLINARYRIGRDSGRTQRMMNVLVHVPHRSHVYDDVASFAQQLERGGKPKAVPLYESTLCERQTAHQWLAEHCLDGSDGVVPFIGVFMGGRLKKRWPGDCWKELLRRLDQIAVKVLLFSGPEEVEFIEEIRLLNLKNLIIGPLQNLRDTAALCLQARLVVSPDTGPLHLAAALEVPVISILQVEGSLAYAPKGIHDRKLLRPSAQDVVKALLAHPNWLGALSGL